jgi:CRISPR system Cascade subunit CasE
MVKPASGRQPVEDRGDDREMSSLYMIEIQFDMSALHNFLYLQGFLGYDDETELGYGMHAWLKAAFGDMAPKPWRLLVDNRRPPRILGYSTCDAIELSRRMIEFAEPSVLQVCPEPAAMIASRLMPKWQTGRKLRFQVLCCPVGRKSRSGVEKDLFLIHADAEQENSRLNREDVYCDWAKQKLESKAMTIDSIKLAGFRLVRLARQTRSMNRQRNIRQIIRPQALFEGVLTIRDPDEFNRVLAHGLGRHRAFGYGMLLLRPMS